MTHAWCQNIPRDEAVRASEDGRSGPLPTLEKAISAVTDRRPVDAGGGENVTGLRTERVVLEITHSEPTRADSWGWGNRLCPWLRSGESVRVVDTHAEEVAQSVAWEGARDAYRGRICRLTAERDAAIRERDTLRAQRITQALTADRFAAAVQEADRLRARVAELESAPAASGAAGTAAVSSEAVAWGFTYANGSTDGRFYNSRALAEEAVPNDGTVVPLFAAPPPASGWLMAEEREAVEWLSQLDQPQYLDGTRKHARVAQALLAREWPPEVVLEDFTPDAICNLHPLYLAGWNQCMALAKRSICAAGVPVKEVG